MSYLKNMTKKNCEYFAHRGANTLLPENTLYAIKQMAKGGIKGIEIDVRLTNDGEVVLLHDQNLQRTTGVNKKIGDITLKELKQLNAASYLKGINTVVEIPTLNEVLKFCYSHNMKCAIELKENEDFSIINKVHDQVESHNMEILVSIYSFNQKMIKEFSRKNPNYPLHLNIEHDPMSYVPLAKENGWGLNPGVMFVTKEFIVKCKQERIDVHVWTVNDREIKNMLECWGVRIIISDDLLQ